MDWRLPWTGGCRCGQVRLEITAPPLITSVCHCTGCQRMASSAFSLSTAIPADGFRVTRGVPVIGGLHGEPRHHFCPHCMSWIFTRIARRDMLVNLRPTMLDDAGWFRPFVETYTCEKLPWVEVPAVHSFERFPSFESYFDLTRAFADWMDSQG